MMLLVSAWVSSSIRWMACPPLSNPPAPKLGKTELKTLGKPYSEGLIAVNMPNVALQKQLLRMLHSGNMPSRYESSAMLVFCFII